ncbi:MAG TPA: MaoC family dehydratase N-terminal domain-containing protein [Nakamurella sp.]|jgi:acyl dehydratase
MDAAFVGRSFPFARAYQVGAEKVREFAAAVGEANPLCRDQAAARAAGYRDLVAPPTFAIAVTAAAQEAVIFNPELGLDFSRVVHGDERFVHHRPIVAGDELRSTVHIDSIRVLAGNDVIGLRTEVTDAHGQPVTTAYATLVSRAA